MKYLVHKLGKWYLNKICKREYELQYFQGMNERPVEYRFVFQSLLLAAPRSVLDVGTGVTSLPHILRICGFEVVAIDNIRDYWPKGMFNRHYYVINDDITHTRLTKNFDLIICISVLEHIPNHEAAIQSMFTLLNPGGRIVLTFPYNEKNYIENVYKLPGAGYGQDSPYICQVFSRIELDKWLKANSGKIDEQEYWQIFTGEYWTFGEQLYTPRQVNKDDKHQLTCILISKEAM
jgi:SAM-dependent methyltransferase